MKVLMIVAVALILSACETTTGIGNGRLIGVKVEGKTLQCEVSVDGVIDVEVCKRK